MGRSRRVVGTAPEYIRAVIPEGRSRADKPVSWAVADEALWPVIEAIGLGFAACTIVVDDDDDAQAVDYRFDAVNTHFTVMTGLVDPVGRTALELVPGLERVWVETYARVGLGRDTLQFEQGSEVMGRWFDVSATPLPEYGRFAIVFTDQTARRRAQEAVRRREPRHPPDRRRAPGDGMAHRRQGRFPCS